MRFLALVGVAAALVPFVAELLEPVMTLLNAIPRVVLAPLFVIWLGVGLPSKVALSFMLVAVLIFFTVFGQHLTHLTQAHSGTAPMKRRLLAVFLLPLALTACGYNTIQTLDEQASGFASAPRE